MVMTLGPHWSTRRKHYWLTCGIFGGWNSRRSCWCIFFEDTTHQLLSLISLKLRDLWLIRSSWRYDSLSRILGAYIIVLKTVPALSTCALWCIFITLVCIHDMALLVIGSHRQSSDVTYEKIIQEMIYETLNTHLVYSWVDGWGPIPDLSRLTSRDC